ncbi:MAG: HEAT repeat domain-containing protein [Bacteroidetes bacterium]|nr:HEAT repeat domain-containing protein [Bacteroidota bacterium]MBU1372730.1 HEAT repeat domain-containing protein [Bacteroidota bacterium]MBU1484926.1 HEAT repeat domain-containing protein [Bacteroidota bacterium]MBU1761540.1 HEAT repeat domain-containing protein [Bacteroidota bacterium]MBU2267088.1 HEAT repeat domain-containing protein [Bacteroidota bacterium]
MIALVVSFLALAMIFVTLGIIYFHRIKTEDTNEEEAASELIIIEELNKHILRYDSLNEVPEKELLNVINKLTRLKQKSLVFTKVLTRTLMSFSILLTGTIQLVINATYNLLKLQEDTFKKLKSKLWFVKIEGLREVQEINDNDSISQVITLTKDNNINVRVSAYAALIQLDSKEKYKFLDDEQETLTLWHQIILTNAMEKIDSNELPDFKRYLGSTNNSIVLLCMKLILHYNQLNAVSSLIKLLSHKDDEIRCFVIQALGKLNADEAEQQLIERYPKESLGNKTQILLSLGNIISLISLKFLTDKFIRGEHFDILKSAAEAINTFPQELKKLVPIDSTLLDEKQITLIKHYEEPLNLYGSI